MSAEYTNFLKDSGIAISMSRKGNLYDNAKAKSLMKTLKYEQVYLSEYNNLADAKAQIGHFLEAVCTRSGCIPAWATCGSPSSSNGSSKPTTRTGTRTGPLYLNRSSHPRGSLHEHFLKGQQ